MCATVSVGRTSVVFRSMFLALLQSSHPGLARAPIMCSHFPHGNEHVIPCLDSLFLASCTALELIHEPRNSLISPSLSEGKSEEAWWLLWLEWESLWEYCPPQSDVITWNIGPQGLLREQRNLRHSSTAWRLSGTKDLGRAAVHGQ